MAAQEEHSNIEQQLVVPPVPKGLQCPLTCYVMRDPVLLLGDGRCYERAAITEWLAQGRLTSPVTGQPLQSVELVAAVALQASCRAFLALHDESKEPVQPWMDPHMGQPIPVESYIFHDVDSPRSLMRQFSPESGVFRRELGQLARLCSEAQLAPLERLRALANEAHNRLSILLAATGYPAQDHAAESNLSREGMTGPWANSASPTPQRSRSPSPGADTANMSATLPTIGSPVRSPSFGHRSVSPSPDREVRSPSPSRPSPNREVRHRYPSPSQTAFPPQHATQSPVLHDSQTSIAETIKEGHEQVEREELDQKVTLRNVSGAIVMAGQDGRIRVVDSLTGTVRAEASLGSTPLPTMAWGPSGQLIAAGGQDGVLRIIEARTAIVMATSTSHAGSVSALAWGPSDERIATGGVDCRIRIVAAATGRIEVESTLGDEVRAIAWVQAGEQLRLALRDGSIRSMDAVTGEVHAECISGPMIPMKAAWNLSGSRLAIGGLSRLQIVDAATGNIEHEVPHGGSILSAVWSPSGAKLATGCWDGRLRVVDVATGRVEADSEHGTIVSAVAWSPAGTLIATGSWDGKIRIVDAASGNVVAEAVLGSVALSAAWRF